MSKDLKTAIEKKFDWDLDKLKDQASAYELVSGPVGYSNGYRTASAELESEVLPILLECVEALETTCRQFTRGYPTFLEWERIRIKNKQALEQIRKWSEGK